MTNAGHGELLGGAYRVGAVQLPVADKAGARLETLGVWVAGLAGDAAGSFLAQVPVAAHFDTVAREDDDRLKTISLFAAQTDFSEAGEITRFISSSQLSFIEKLMAKRGYLGSESMGGAFSALRSSASATTATSPT